MKNMINFKGFSIFSYFLISAIIKEQRIKQYKVEFLTQNMLPGLHNCGKNSHRDIKFWLFFLPFFKYTGIYTNISAHKLRNFMRDRVQVDFGELHSNALSETLS